jgi:serine/threonine protein kinase
LETSELNLKEKRILSGGIYHNEAKMDFPCAFKMATDDTQLMKLKREREILELIRTRDLHQESHKYLVNWLYPSQLMSEENVYFLNQSGDQLSDTASVSGLVLESGGKNLREFLRKETLISVPMSQRIHILEEVVDAVRFLHRLGIVHFDLKPENIVHFSSRDAGRWTLIDFDSSYNERSSPSDSLPRTATGANLWLSEEFMCPEIAAVVGYLNRHQGNTTPANVAINSSNTFQSDVAINWKMDIWSLGMVAYFLFTNHSLWSDYSAAPFNHSMVSSISQEELQLILSRSLGHKEKSFVESCLKRDPFARLNTTELLGKSLFSTGNSTVHANTLKVTNESMMSRFDEIQRMIKAYSDRCSPELITEELTDKFSDLYECLSSQLDRIENMTREEINALLRMRSST